MKKEGLPRRNTKDCGRIRGWRFRGPKKDYGILPRRKCWKIEEFYPKKMDINCGNMKLCMKKTFSAVCCGRMWKVKKQKWRS